eukprot:s3541_g8.t1
MPATWKDHQDAGRDPTAANQQEAGPTIETQPENSQQDDVERLAREMSLCAMEISRDGQESSSEIQEFQQETEPTKVQQETESIENQQEAEPTEDNQRLSQLGAS